MPKFDSSKGFAGVQANAVNMASMLAEALLVLIVGYGVFRSSIRRSFARHHRVRPTHAYGATPETR